MSSLFDELNGYVYVLKSIYGEHFYVLALKMSAQKMFTIN